MIEKILEFMPKKFKFANLNCFDSRYDTLPYQQTYRQNLLEIGMTLCQTLVSFSIFSIELMNQQLENEDYFT